MGDYLVQMPFLDSDPGTSRSTGQPEISSRRPWTLYWPPQPGSTLYSLIHAEFPELLAWRFDPSKPFDRPWQQWTEQARNLGKLCQSLILPTAESIKTDPNTQSAEAWVCERSIVTDEQRLERELSMSKLDRQLGLLKLPFVIPETFNYMARQASYSVEKPFHSRLSFLHGVGQNNSIASESHAVKIHNVSGFEKEFKLSTSGFEFENVPVDMETWTTDSVRNEYLPAMEAWLRTYFQASFVHIYTYNFRSLDSSRAPSAAWLQPFVRAHCDVTKNSSKSRLSLHLPQEAPKLVNRRCRFIGLWRPLTGPEQDCPLAMCDFRSLRPDDLVPADVVFPHYCDEGYEVKYSDKHRWFYKQGMSVDEVILLKHYDSSDKEATCCVHSGFHDSTVAPGTPTRASVELRAIVID